MAVCLAVVAAACSSSDGETATTTSDTTATTATTTTTTTPTTTVPAFSSDDALSVTNAYFEAYNSGDVSAVIGLFATDATFADNFGLQTPESWQQLLAWNAAQGTVLSPPDCTVTEADLGVSVTVACPHTNLGVLVQAVDGPPVPINLTLTITPDGVSQWRSIFGNPDFNTVAKPFDDWMTVNHPEDFDNVGFGKWTTVNEAEENGIRTARYAADWATYLNDNGCGYSDGC
jgi:ketosteroid isomerase-like protein